MEIDIEKLHDVIEGNTGRGAGNTLALVIQALQSADVYVDETQSYYGNFAIIAPNHLVADMMLNLAIEAADAIGIPIRRNPGTRSLLLGENIRNELLFVPHDAIMTRLRGRRLVNYFIEPYVQYTLTDNQETFLEDRLKRE